jgi:hypothetical protein
MSDWYCFKDKVKMTDADLTLSYLQLTQKVPGIKCSICGVTYLTEDIVTNIVEPAEKAIEQK